jgi:flagellar FliJ protein
MKQFAFGPEKILDLRKFLEDEAKLELGRAVSVLADLENKLLLLGREQTRAAAAQFKAGNSAAMIQQYMYYLLRLDNTKEQLQKEAALAELKVEEARNAFLERSRDRKILDKLKEKRHKEFRKEVLREETKTIDEISSGAPARRLFSDFP